MSKYSGIAHYQDFNELVKLLGQSNSTYDIDKITKAYKFAEKAHGDQRRVSGIPYILHPTSVACILAELGMDTDFFTMLLRILLQRLRKLKNFSVRMLPS